MSESTFRDAIEALRHKRVRVRKNGERTDYVRWSDVWQVLQSFPSDRTTGEGEQ